MRNDARPIGEEFQGIAEYDHHKQERRPRPAAPAQQAGQEDRTFVVDRDPGDEERPAADR